MGISYEKFANFEYGFIHGFIRVTRSVKVQILGLSLFKAQNLLSESCFVTVATPSAG